MKRREFIALLGGVATWPMAVRAQQSAKPVIGFLTTRASGEEAHLVTAFHQGLQAAGYVDGQNLTVEYRFAENQNERLPELADSLVRQNVAAIVAGGGVVSAIAAKNATAIIPVIFANGSDPVKFGLVASLNRPGANVTGVTVITNELGTKRAELLRELVPSASTIVFLVNPINPNADTDTRDAEAAVHAFGRQIHVLRASNKAEIGLALTKASQLPSSVLLIASDNFFSTQTEHLAALATQNAIPSMYSSREFAEAGGLIGYGASRTDMYRQAGVYAGRVLQGEKPADLPVLQPTKFELVINLKTAKALGLTVPNTILVSADEVIE
jgi:putative tryptophan/tyrosine transport system substrate-binding protein